MNRIPEIGSRVLREVSSMASKVREGVTPNRVLVASGLITAASVGMIAGAGLATEGRILIADPVISVPLLTAYISSTTGLLAQWTLEKSIR